MLKRSLLLAMLVLLVLSTACTLFASQPSPTEPPVTLVVIEPTEPATPTPTETPLPPTETPPPTSAADQPTAAVSGPLTYGPDSYPAGFDPLTGQSAADTALLDRRPLSVKVQIFPRMQRPPWGVSQADIVYDYYQNSGMTRFHAIFYSKNAERVGPIRSARLFDQHLMRMYKSILAFGGADRRILRVFLNADFSNRLVTETSHNCPPMCRVDPNGFNFLVTDTAGLTQYTSDKGVDNSRQNLNGMFFAETPPAGGQPAQQATVRFSISAYTRWDYEAAGGRYLRFQDTREAATIEDEGYAPMPDGLTGQQIAADNVVILYVGHAYAFQTRPGNSEIIDILFSGGGPAYILRDGQIYEVRWNRPNEASVLYLTGADGQPFPFKPGTTWFEVIGQSSKMSSPAAGVWRFIFSIP